MKLNFQSSHQPSAVRRELPAAGLRTSDFGPRTSRSGVALVITVIMLSVITFMAVTFLALSRREKGVVATTRDMTFAGFAKDAAIDRAKAEILAGILGTSNTSAFGLLVSTNYINWNGFVPGNTNFLNVNFDYMASSGNALSLNDSLENLNNLYFNPRPPVFVANGSAGPAGGNDFRYYLDLNRNGRHDRSGYWPVTNSLGTYVDLNGNATPTYDPARIQWNFVTGDPEWIGVLERPGFPHSGTNRFVSRYAYMVVPAGKTLDLNYIHNQTKPILGFRRNQGVGSWEINLASFLVDLNTNAWPGPNLSPPVLGMYSYPEQRVFFPSQFNTGFAFDDAKSLLLYRYGGNLNTLTNPLPIDSGYLDESGNGDISGYPMELQSWTNDFNDVAVGFPGANNINHYFTAQEFYDTTKTASTPIPGADFSGRLSNLGTSNSTYDAYTYYRMLSQLGTDSAYEETDKLNLNYVNVGGLAATNFVRWDNQYLENGNPGLGIPKYGVPGSMLLFTNIANRLLSRYTQDWRDNDFIYYRNFFGTDQPFDATRIPVMLPNNRFVYSPAVNRLLQLAANITSMQVGADDRFPLVFRPVFKRDASGVHITRYEQVTGDPNTFLSPPIDVLTVPSSPSEQRINVFGVPWIIGAKKGLPNFNECAMHSVVQLTRKMQITRPVTLAGTWTTNLMYVMSVSNSVGVELWNSYRTAYPTQVLIRVTGDLLMTLTNEYGVAKRYNVPLSNGYPLIAISNVVAWPGTSDPKHINGRSFVVPLQTNIMFLPESAYVLASRNFISKSNSVYETGQGFPEFKWGLNCAMRLRVIMQEKDVNGPILDYVQFDGLDVTRNIAAEIAKRNTTTVGIGLATIENKVWDPRISAWGMTVGMTNQIAISLGIVPAGSDWTDYGSLNPSDKQAAIASFSNFLSAATVPVSQTAKQVPFTPTASRDLMISWQANDPMVHYMASDLLSEMPTNKNTLKNLQLLPQLGGANPVNNRYMPWGGNPNKPGNVNDYSLDVKDPLVASSDDWEFPTNAVPNIGWLGRIHRGTPWQTVYLKASDLGVSNAPTSASLWLLANLNTATNWANWSGNPELTNSFYTRPATDRVLFDIFTTALNENATRGQLPINQEGLAAWSAVLGGVVAITNTSSLSDLQKDLPPRFGPRVVQPAGYYDPANTSIPLPALVKIVNGINNTRTNTGMFPSRSFKHLGDILATPELTTSSPFLDTGALVSGHNWQVERGINDAAYEWIPQQIMSLLRVGEPRFVVYAYGQALQPAENSVITTSGPFFGLCTNYQIMAETAARAVVRVEGSPNPSDINNPNPKLKYPPRLVVESYNVLGPD